MALQLDKLRVLQKVYLMDPQSANLMAGWLVEQLACWKDLTMENLLVASMADQKADQKAVNWGQQTAETMAVTMARLWAVKTAHLKVQSKDCSMV